MNAPSIKIYDPRLHQDFVATDQQSGRTFKSCAAGFLVADCVGDLNWLGIADSVDNWISRASSSGFFTFAPWARSARRFRSMLAADYTVVVDSEALIAGHFDTGVVASRHLLEAREECGGWQAGELVFGSSSGSVAFMEEFGGRQFEPWELVIREGSRIGCALYLGEMRRSTLLVREAADFDSVTSALGRLQEKA
jgi:hypothetical protein